MTGSEVTAPLDRPHTVWERGDVMPHRGRPGLVGAIAATAEDRLIARHHLDRHRALVRVHPDHDPLLLFLPRHFLHLLIDTNESGQEGTAA
jgi:hypothetical protein